MTPLSRRGFIAGVAIASTATLGLEGRATASGAPLLLYDPGLAAGRRFAGRAAALGGRAVALEGDRVRQMQALLAMRPSALFGVTRRSDDMLVGEIAVEAGYRRVAHLRQGGDAIVSDCAPDGVAVAVLARLAGPRWPEAFAALALDAMDRCAAPGQGQGQGAVATPGMGWMIVRREGG